MGFEDIIRKAGNLPVSEVASQVNKSLRKNNNLVVTAPPGAGKSTLLPLTILADMDAEHTSDANAGKVLVLEPRRLAAYQIAERMASIIGETVGKTIGYRVRFDTKVTKSTRIEVITEGILTRMLVDDPTLEGVGVVIFDEFHERSINSDLALALARQSQAIIRPDLRLVIMSATIDASGICQALKAPLIESKGKMFDVHISHAQEDTTPLQVAESVARDIIKAHREQQGDILAFLPGQGEIIKCQELLDHALGDTAIYPLYGNLQKEEQQLAISPSKPGERKVVLATPIAETSLTIEGVRIVIDSGYCRKLKFDARTGLSHLETVRISKDMATQRAGRAGRIAEGYCYRLWTKATELRMEEQRVPEIVEADLASLVLSIAAFGENDIEGLPWITPPSKSNVLNARNLLRMLEAIDEDGNITEYGKKMASLPCHPRIAKMILSIHSQKALACDIAALLEEKDPLPDSEDSDLTLRVMLLRQNRKRWKRMALIAKEYRRMAHVEETDEEVDATDVGKLIAFAYPECIAMAIDNIGNYKLASGAQVFIDKKDPMSAHNWLAIASLNTTGKTGKVFLSAPIDIDTIPTTEQDNVMWDNKQGQVMIQREKRIGKLVVSSKPIQQVDHTKVVAIICEAIKKYGLSMLDWNESVKQLQQRVEQVSKWHPELELPDLSTEHLMASAATWLSPYLIEDGKVKTSVAELKKLNLEDIVWNSIPYDQQQAINRIAPTHILVPTGSRIRINYRVGSDAPVLSVRLQECFGMESTPCVNDGKQPLLMELLSPGFKPVQLTQDLVSFWDNTYNEVRKELKRRYPKHEWPENPREAEPVRGVRRKK